VRKRNGKRLSYLLFYFFFFFWRRGIPLPFNYVNDKRKKKGHPQQPH
jgi:hypothetical protein